MGLSAHLDDNQQEYGVILAKTLQCDVNLSPLVPQANMLPANLANNKPDHQPGISRFMGLELFSSFGLNVPDEDIDGWSLIDNELCIAISPQE